MCVELSAAYVTVGIGCAVKEAESNCCRVIVGRYSLMAQRTSCSVKLMRFLSPGT